MRIIKDYHYFTEDELEQINNAEEVIINGKTYLRVKLELEIIEIKKEELDKLILSNKTKKEMSQVLNISGYTLDKYLNKFYDKVIIRDIIAIINKTKD